MFMTKTIYHHSVPPQILKQVLIHSINDIKNHPTLEGKTSEIPFFIFSSILAQKLTNEKLF